MKRNVDLTEDQRFTTPEPLTGIGELMHNLVISFKPWDFEHFRPVYSDDMHANDDIFPVGNKEERKRYRDVAAVENGELCERCGRKLNRIPWVHGICSCHFEWLKQHRDLPWDFTPTSSFSRFDFFEWI